MSSSNARITLGLAILIAILSGASWVLALPLAAFAVFLIVWGHSPGPTEQLVRKLPGGEQLSRGLRYIDGIIAPQRDRSATDELAEDISWAIDKLVNCNPLPTTDTEVARWENDYRAWCERVSHKLENRALFTRAEQRNFDDLGFVERVQMTGHPRHDWLLSQLKMKIERLREIISRH
jgi:hypothetical protein